MNANILQIISTFTLESIQLNQIALYEHLRFESNDLFPLILMDDILYAKYKVVYVYR